MVVLAALVAHQYLPKQRTPRYRDGIDARTSSKIAHLARRVGPQD
jgi:hypothetical protein